ncbi:putative protein OS=Lysinibacillus sphaericus OX=1421 GN=LS41612_21905 PE=4 SV=1 [Lysinibacillus sphaericus]
MLLDCDEQLFITYRQSGETERKVTFKRAEAEVTAQADPKILGFSLYHHNYF